MLPHFQLSLLLLSVVIATCSCETVIDIDSSAPSGSQSNLFHHLCTTPEQLQSDTVMVLSSGMYEIDDGPSCVVSNINNLTIRGVDTDNLDNVSELFCGFNFFGRNFIFLNITNLIFENLVVSGCGAYIPQGLPSYVNDSFAYFGEKQKAVFLFSRVTNLYIQNVIMSANYGYGIVGVNLLGDTRLNRVRIVGTDNTKHPLCFGYETDLSCTGSGALFLYSDPSNDSSFESNNGTLVVSNSMFDFNKYIVPLSQYLAVYTVARSPFETQRITIIGATGVTVYTGQRSYFMDIQIHDSVFRDNDGQTSSLLFLPYNSLRDSYFSVNNCTFQNNQARPPGRGGGLSFLILVFVNGLKSFPEYPDDVYTIISITNSEFTDNEAYVGGAIYLHLTPQNVTDYSVNIDTVSFTRNIATLGSALSANSIPTLFDTKPHGVLLQDVTVTNNTFPSTLLTTTPTIDNSAAFVFTLIDNVTISGRNETKGSLFSHNSPGAVLSAGGKLFVRGHIEFSDNLAFRGGALALFDYTVLHIHEGSRIKFKRNHAIQTGGAIFANSLGTGVLDVCVIQIVGTHRISDAADTDLLDLQLRFENNSADVAGNSIYASPLYNCAYLPEASTVQNVFGYREQDIYNAIFDLASSVQNGNQEVTSLPDRISFCDTSDYTSIPVKLVTNITTIPGKKFSFLLIPLDGIFTKVQSVMYSDIDNDLLKLGPAQSTQSLSGRNCSQIDFNIYGPENSNGNMFLYARLGGVGLTIEITMGNCPPGFHLATVNDLQQCTCDVYVLEVMQTTCNTSTYTILRPGRSWMGHVDQENTSDVIWVNTCPIGHCNPDIQDVDLLVQDQICEPGRSGTLCGQCREGLSVVFGSATCMQCTHYWLFSIIIYAIVGFLIVVVLFLLNLTVTKGTINGLIFYVNVVSVNSSVFFESTTSFNKVFVSLLNLELGFPVCFFDGMDEAAKIGLQFVFPTYLLALCLLLIFLVKWSSRMQKLTSCNSISVLATLVYLSYGKVLRTVIDSLSFATVNSEFKAHTIWLYDGNLAYFTGVHIVLGLSALVATIVFLVPYTVPLVFIRQIDKHSIRFKPLFDAYGGPYKDKYRYWFGLRLILLTAMCLTYAIAGTDFQSLALSLETFFLLWFTVWQAYVKPYKNRAIAILDLFFLINFLTMSIWVLHLVDDVTFLATSKRDGMVMLLVSIVFVVTIGILIYHIYCTIYNIVPKFQEKMDKLCASVRSVDSYQRFKQFKYVMTKGLTKSEKSETMSGTNTLEPPKVTVTQTEVSLNDLQAVPERSETFSSYREPVMDYAN